jgi:hypothetical protein
MMVEKESSKLRDTEFPSVWSEDLSIEGDLRYVSHLEIEDLPWDIAVVQSRHGTVSFLSS